MNTTQQLHNLGQSLWLDNITRDLLDSGGLKQYIENLSVTGLTSNPTIFDQAIKKSAAYDAAIRQRSATSKSVIRGWTDPGAECHRWASCRLVAPLGFPGDRAPPHGVAGGPPSISG